MARNHLTVSKETKTRVERRIALASRPYVARRRDFSKGKPVSLMVAQAVVTTCLTV